MLVRPSSKVVIKFLSVMQKHGKFRSSPRTYSFTIPSPIALGQHIDISRVDIMQSWTAAPGIGGGGGGRRGGKASAGYRGRRGVVQEEDSGVITNGHLAGVFGGPHQRSSLRLRESKVGNCYAYRVERHYFHLIGANFRRATCPTFRSPTLALALRSWRCIHVEKTAILIQLSLCD